MATPLNLQIFTAVTAVCRCDDHDQSATMKMESTEFLGHYCTACGNANPMDANFCDHCGLPMRRRSLAPGAEVVAAHLQAKSDPGLLDVPEFVPHRSRAQRWLAPAAALACVLVFILGAVIWQSAAPPPTSQEVFGALRAAGVQVASPPTDLLCLNDLSYYRHHIQVQPSDQITRRWLDALVQAGLYAPAVEVFPDGLSADSVMQYQSLPALNPWRRAGGLCVAQGWALEAVMPDSIRKKPSADAPRLVATVVWRAQGVAPWLNQLPPLGLRLPGVDASAVGLTTHTSETLERQGGRWVLVR